MRKNLALVLLALVVIFTYWYTLSVIRDYQRASYNAICWEKAASHNCGTYVSGEDGSVQFRWCDGQISNKWNEDVLSRE